MFTTYGGATAGDSLYEAASILKKKGYTILGGLKIEGSDSYPQGRELGINAGRPDDADLLATAEFIDRILEAKKAGRSLDPEMLASPTPFFAAVHGKPHAALVKKMRKGIEGKVLFNKEQCLFCETCKKSCPTRSIASGEKFPEFSWKCIDGLRCFQCVRVCPGKALSVEFPGPVDDYRKFRDESADSLEEKLRTMITCVNINFIISQRVLTADLNGCHQYNQLRGGTGTVGLTEFILVTLGIFVASWIVLCLVMYFLAPYFAKFGDARSRIAYSAVYSLPFAIISPSAWAARCRPFPSRASSSR